MSFFLKKLHFIFWALVLSSTLCLLGMQKLVALFGLLGLCVRVWHLFCTCSEKGFIYHWKLPSAGDVFRCTFLLR